MITSRRNVTYDQVLEVARKYAAGFRDFNLPAAQRAITAELGFSPATWLSHLIRQAMDQLVTEGRLTAFGRGEPLPGGGSSVYREYRRSRTDDSQPAHQLTPKFQAWLTSLSDEQRTALAGNWANVMDGAALDRIDSWIIAGNTIAELHKQQETGT